MERCFEEGREKQQHTQQSHRGIWRSNESLGMDIGCRQLNNANLYTIFGVQFQNCSRDLSVSNFLLEKLKVERHNGHVEVPELLNHL